MAEPLETIVATKQRASYGEDALAFYRANYDGYTPGELRVACKGLYQRLHRDGLLDELPRKEAFGGDPLAAYYDEHAGLTRGQLAVENRALYNALYRLNLHMEIPLKPKVKRAPVLPKRTPDYLAICRRKYPNVSRGELNRVDHALYERLRYHGLHKQIPTRKMMRRMQKKP